MTGKNDYEYFYLLKFKDRTIQSLENHEIRIKKVRFKTEQIRVTMSLPRDCTTKRRSKKALLLIGRSKPKDAGRFPGNLRDAACPMGYQGNSTDRKLFKYLAAISNFAFCIPTIPHSWFAEAAVRLKAIFDRSRGTSLIRKPQKSLIKHCTIIIKLIALRSMEQIYSSFNLSSCIGCIGCKVHANQRDSF